MSYLQKNAMVCELLWTFSMDKKMFEKICANVFAWVFAMERFWGACVF
jgi:hypothetical protein